MSATTPPSGPEAGPQPSPPSDESATPAQSGAVNSAHGDAAPGRHDAAWPRGASIAVGAALAVAALALALAWSTRQRQDTAEQAIVKRQQEAAEQAGEARALARQSEAVTRESAAKLALLEARVAETSLQRSQLEELIQALARSRDENLLADVEASVRVALQQSAITGSAEPLLAALRQAEQRLARFQQPRLERVRRAVLQDLERLKGLALADVPTLSLRIDEAVRSVDQLPLLATLDRSALRRDDAAGSSRTGAPRADGGAAPSKADPAAGTTGASAARGAPAAASPDAPSAPWAEVIQRIWADVRSLVRVTRVESPEAALLAPEQAFFLRENLKLRLLNARLALLSRQFDIAQADLAEALAWIERYFDRSSRRVAAASESLRLVAQQSRQVGVPRPDATLAALAAASGTR